MIDIRFLRENPDVVKQNIRNKFQDSKLPLVDEVIALDEELRQSKRRADDLRANRNKVSKSIGALMGQKKFEEAEEAKKIVAEQAKELVKKKKATSVILAHNHPMGSAVASSDDIVTTGRLTGVFATLGVRLIAHYIVADGEISKIDTSVYGN